MKQLDMTCDSNNTSCRKDRKSTRLNSSHANISYAVFCLKKKTLALLVLDALGHLPVSGIFSPSPVLSSLRALAPHPFISAPLPTISCLLVPIPLQLLAAV